MTKADILSDLEYVKTLAEEGRNAPLLGGRLGVMWGVLLAVTFTGHWLIASGAAELPQKWLMVLWIGFGLCGGIGSTILGKSISSKAGIATAGNRAETIIWSSFGLAMLICFAGIFTNILLNKGAALSFDAMLILGWTGQGLAYLSIARISGDARLKTPAILAFISAFAVLALYGNLVIYLISAVSALITVVIPGLAQMQREPSDVV